MGLGTWGYPYFFSSPEIYPDLLSPSLGFCRRFGLQKPKVLHLKKCGSSTDRGPDGLLLACSAYL